MPIQVTVVSGPHNEIPKQLRNSSWSYVTSPYRPQSIPLPRHASHVILFLPGEYPIDIIEDILQEPAIVNKYVEIIGLGKTPESTILIEGDAYAPNGLEISPGASHQIVRMHNIGFKGRGYDQMIGCRFDSPQGKLQLHFDRVHFHASCAFAANKSTDDSHAM